MSLTPISRDAMLSLKALKDEEIRQKAESDRKDRILKIVQEIYDVAKRVAEKSTNTRYAHKIPGGWFRRSTLLGIVSPHLVFPSHHQNNHITLESMNHSDYKFYTDNMEDILAYLRSLFPGCVVDQQLCSFVRGRNGEEYDVTTVDNALLPALGTPTQSEVIVVDWS